MSQVTEPTSELRLPDGVRVADLFDREMNEVQLRVMSDPDLYKLEMQHLFPRVWNVLAHESEIPNPGDFVTRSIGEDPVIVSRDRDGEVHVLLNVCPHRGMQVCRTDMGNDRSFKCPYHGWTFDNKGNFLAAPVSRERMQGDLREKSELGLAEARCEIFGGMIFANWNEDAPSLEEHLGGVKWYMDLMFNRTDSGLEALGPPQRFMINANWKAAGEQHNVDGYHTMSLHRSLVQMMGMSDEDELSQKGVNISSNGHALRCVDMKANFQKMREMMSNPQLETPLDRLRTLPPAGMTPELVEQLPDRFSEEQLRVLSDTPPRVGGLFPNMGMFSLNFPAPDGRIAGVISWHAFVPRGPDRFEFFNWFLVEKDVPEEVKALCRRTANLSFGNTGYVESDDADTWPQITHASKGYMGGQQTMKYQALLGENRPEDWPGPGKVYAGFTKDDSQWNYWLRYQDFMCGKPW